MTTRFSTVEPAPLRGRRLWAFVAAGTIAFPAWAGSWRQLDQTIFGMDCAPCAAGVEKSLSRLHGVTAVHVSLNEGRTVLSLAPGSRVTLAQIREAIRHNGFTPKEARGTAVTQVRSENRRLWVEIAGERFVLETRSAGPDAENVSAGTEHEVRLSLRVPEALADPPELELISVGGV